MKCQKQDESERLLNRVAELLRVVITRRDVYGRLRTEMFQQANSLLSKGLPAVRRELEGTRDGRKLKRVIDLAIEVQNLAKEELKR
jgi:hypothetical protein